MILRITDGCVSGLQRIMCLSLVFLTESVAGETRYRHSIPASQSTKIFVICRIEHQSRVSPHFAILVRMSRTARVVVVGVPHHITQRGNNRQTVFRVDDDYQLYLGLLHDYTCQHKLDIWAFCLMSNHVHIIATPRTVEGMSRAIGDTHMRYAQHCHADLGSSGHLWQGRFSSCPLDGPHLWEATRYIELNPVRAKLVSHAWEWPWSSAAVRCSGYKHPLLASSPLDTCNATWWRDYLISGEETSAWKNLRDCTRTGRVCGDDQFIHSLEESLGCNLTVRLPGRPRKTK